MEPHEKLIRAIWNSPDFDEWWATDKANEFVFVTSRDNRAVRVTITPTFVPDVAPSAVEAGEAPHPFGWRGDK